MAKTATSAASTATPTSPASAIPDTGVAGAKLRSKPKKSAKVENAAAAKARIAVESAPKGAVTKQSERPVKAKQRPDAEAREKAKKTKLIRDSFTIPESEYAALGEVKRACIRAGFEVKKSQLLRAGVALVRQMDVARLREVLDGLPTLKAGRPKKNK